MNSIQIDEQDIEVDQTKIAHINMEWQNGYCHINYAYHNEKELTTFVAGARKKVVIGNWKSNGTKSLIDYFNMCIVPAIQKESSYIDCIIAPPDIYGSYLKELIQETKVQVGAQDMSPHSYLDVTGASTAEQLQEQGINWVIVGQAERRFTMQEDELHTLKKVREALDKGLNVVYCLGDTVLEKQTAASLGNVLAKKLEKLKDWISDEEYGKITFAYEPYWKIYDDYKPGGPWKDVDFAMQGCAGIRNWIMHNISKDVSRKARVIYGGPVGTEMAEALMLKYECDGFLLLDDVAMEDDFAKIIKVVSEHQFNKEFVEDV